MRFRRIYLGDFGIFQNESMDGIGQGLVVIGGPNRAGKTTLMAALRYLGYGVPRRGDIPPAVHDYEIRADVERNGCNYSILAEGYANPKVAAVDNAPEATIEELYNHLDRFTYSQIFTISLDELRQLPDNIDSEDKKRISTVLLGAGWSDALQLLQLKNTLNNDAERIGGSSGKLNIKKFKEYYVKLEEGLKLRDEANEQMDTYDHKCGRIEKLTKELIPATTNKIEEKEEERQRLELIKEHFTRFQTYKSNKRELEKDANRLLLETYPDGGKQQAESLKARYEGTLNKEKTAQERFISLTGCEPGSDLYAILLVAADKLGEFKSQVSGWEARIDTINSESEDLEQRNNNLSGDLKELCGTQEEKEGLSLLNSIKADQISERELQHTVKKYNDLENQCRQKENELADLEAILEEKTEKLKTLPSVNSSLLKNIIWMLCGNVLAVILLSFLLTVGVAITVGFAGSIGILAYFIRQNAIEQAKAKQLSDLEREINDCQIKKQALIVRKKEVRKEFENIEDSILVFKQKHNIPADVDAAFLPDFIRSIRNLQREQGQICSKGDKLSEFKQTIEEELSPVLSLLKDLGLLDEKHEDVFHDTDVIFNQLTKSTSYLKAAQEFQTVANNKEDLEKNILLLLEQEDPGVREKLGRQAPLFLLEDFIARGQEYEELKKKANENDTLRQVIESHLDTERWRLLLSGSKENGNTDNGDLLLAFGSWCEEFASAEEVKYRQDGTKENIKKLKDELQQFSEEEKVLTNETKELASHRKLLEAKKIIDDAREKLNKLLEKYTVFRISSFMLERLNEKLIESTRATLLDPASKIFSKITSEDYGRIELPPDTLQTNFKVLMQNGREQSIDILSRATREQLFFSIRLSRIRDIKPELPVILDDTFANFDPVHTREAVKYLLELAETHQVFVLTCHPEFLDYIETEGGSSSCQFWGLQGGTFLGPFTECAEVNRLLIRR